MTANGFTQISVSTTDFQKLESIMAAEGLKTKSEAFRMLMRDWERNRKPEIVNGPLLSPGNTFGCLKRTEYLGDQCIVMTVSQPGVVDIRSEEWEGYP